MARIIDITDKLSFEGKPKLIIKGVEIAVNDEAQVILKVLPKLNDFKPQDIVEVCELLFSPEEREKLEMFKFNFKDFTTVVMQAVKLVSGDDEDAGETQTPATT